MCGMSVKRLRGVYAYSSTSILLYPRFYTRSRQRLNEGSTSVWSHLPDDLRVPYFCISSKGAVQGAILLKCIQNYCKFKGAPPKVQGLSKFYKWTSPTQVFATVRNFEKLRKSCSLDGITRLCLPQMRTSNAHATYVVEMEK